MKVSCDQCNLVSINGVVCHEIGCPRAHIDPITNKPYIKKCVHCGCEFQPDGQEITCSNECAHGYFY